jgi:hypothetical protein
MDPSLPSPPSPEGTHPFPPITGVLSEVQRFSKTTHESPRVLRDRIKIRDRYDGSPPRLFLPRDHTSYLCRTAQIKRGSEVVVGKTGEESRRGSTTPAAEHRKLIPASCHIPAPSPEPSSAHHGSVRLSDRGPARAGLIEVRHEAERSDGFGCGQLFIWSLVKFSHKISVFRHSVVLPRKQLVNQCTRHQRTK